MEDFNIEEFMVENFDFEDDLDVKIIPNIEFNNENYEKDEMAEIKNHINKYFGEIKDIVYYPSFSETNIGICIIEPDEERNYYTVVTLGMGSKLMNVPSELRHKRLERAELVICLPKEWKIGNSDNDNWEWPFQWLEMLVKHPVTYNTWIGFGHTILAEGSICEITKMKGVMIALPESFEKNGAVCTLPGGDEVNFYQIIPMYEEEIKYKMENGTESMLEFMKSEKVDFINIGRKNICKEDENSYLN